MAFDDTGFRVYLLKQDVQTAIRYFFIVAWVVVAKLGSWCCRGRTNLRILSGRNIAIASMTGWIQGVSVLRTAWTLRSLPGGWLGFLMVAVFPLSLLSDLGLNYFLVALDVEATCQFARGLVIDSNAASPLPGNQGQAYTWSNQAQLYAFNNNNMLQFEDRTGPAVYRKANNDSSFLPRTGTDTDVIGLWNCGFTGSAIQYNGQDDDAIETDLLSQNLLYPDYTILGTASTQADGTFSQLTDLRQLILVSWSSATVGDIWDIKAVVDMNDTDPTTNSKSMQGYHCQAYDTTDDNEVSQIISKIAINATMPGWMAGIQGILYSGIDATTAYPDADFLIAWIMNNMMMVSGGQQSVSHVPASGASLEYGCFENGTQITLPAVILIGVVILLILFLTGAVIVLKIAVKIACKKYDQQHPNGGVTAKQIIDSAPGSLVMWMQHASYEGTGVQEHPKPTALKGWKFISNKGKQDKMGIVTPGSDHQPLGQSVDVALPEYGNGYGTGYTGYGNAKGGYSQLHTQEVR